MNTTTRSLLAASAALLVGGATACTDITTEPVSTATGTNIFQDPGSYRSFLAKMYGGLSLTGQQGPAGNGDIEGIDEGFSSYLRQYWQLEQLPTDEAIIGWGDQGLPELNTMQWGAANPFLTAMYYRVFYQVMLANEFLRETTPEKLSQRNVPAQLAAEIQNYRAEARFLRALSYWHGIDLFGNIPLVTEESQIGATPPQQATRQEIFDFLVVELNDMQAGLPAAGQAEYGRADRGAALMLLGKLYLNSQVYTGTARYNEARAAMEALIASGAYQLDDDYLDMFLADNHTSPEIIFPVPFDGRFTRNWGGMTYLVHAGLGGSMNPGNFGVNFAWWGLRVRPEVYDLHLEGDERADIFWTDGQTNDINDIFAFTDGIGAPKYRNVTQTGQPGSNEEFPDTDFPMFRLGDAYLMYAEAVLRGGGGSTAQAVNYVNLLRQRSFGDASGNITAGDLTLGFILDERARELLWEAHRRTDLIRFGRFAGATYVWTFKGGSPNGQATASHLNLYPIPSSELSANPNLTQNPGYNTAN